MLTLDKVSLTIDGDNQEKKEILREISIKFEAGKIYAITGPNGGGKTSLAKTIMGIYKHDSGRILFQDSDISQLNVSQRAGKGISYAFQHPPRFKGLPIFDLMKIAEPNMDILTFRKYLVDVGLCPEDYQERDVGPGLSGGEMKRIEIAQILARQSIISIFDEPEAGVDLWTIQRLIGIIMNRFRNNHDKLAIIITHNEALLPVCDEIIVIEDGMIKNQGVANDIWPMIKFDIECKMKDLCKG